MFIINIYPILFFSFEDLSLNSGSLLSESHYLESIEISEVGSLLSSFDFFRIN